MLRKRIAIRFIFIIVHTIIKYYAKIVHVKVLLWSKLKQIIDKTNFTFKKIFEIIWYVYQKKY